MAIVYLSLGSNSGDRLANLQQATSFLSMLDDVDILETSAFYETQPWGVKNQPWFINAVVKLSTALTPQKLLFECQKIESLLGRNRDTEIRWGERTLDIDVLFYDSEILVTDNLKIPHKYLHERAFVLVPMLEIAPDFIHPVFEKTIEELYNELNKPEEVFLYGTI